MSVVFFGLFAFSPLNYIFNDFIVCHLGQTSFNCFTIFQVFAFSVLKPIFGQNYI